MLFRSDKITSGFQKSNLIILAARPAMGKTSLALGIARHLGVAARVPVVVFSLEMSREEVAQRFISTEAKVDSSRMRSGDVRAPIVVAKGSLVTMIVQSPTMTLTAKGKALENAE